MIKVVSARFFYYKDSLCCCNKEVPSDVMLWNYVNTLFCNNLSPNRVGIHWFLPESTISMVVMIFLLFFPHLLVGILWKIIFHSNPSPLINFCYWCTYEFFFIWCVMIHYYHYSFWCFKFSQIWPVGCAEAGSHVLLTCLHHFLSTFLFSSTIKCSGLPTLLQNQIMWAPIFSKKIWAFVILKEIVFSHPLKEKY